jgi:membrane protein implicated in regulation of membrane protease activity
MTVELVRLALRAVVAATPSWALWLGLTSFMVVAAILILFYERCRRRTYIEVLEAIQPGTLLLDVTHHRGEIAVFRLVQPRLIAHSDSVSRRV